MAHDTPDLAEILRSVHEFIRDLKPRLDGMDRYQALCAQMLLEIALRELPEWQPRESADDARLRTLCGAGPEVPREALAARLAAGIAAGEFDQRLDALADDLLRHVVAKVRVSRPQHLEPEHRAD